MIRFKNENMLDKYDIIFYFLLFLNFYSFAGPVGCGKTALVEYLAAVTG